MARSTDSVRAPGAARPEPALPARPALPSIALLDGSADPGNPGLPALPKAPTGIQGLDEITGGGLPRGRPTLVCGAAGCGKTLLGIEFLVRGAVEQGEPGVFFAFEETPEELAANVRSLGFDLDELAARGRLAVEHVHVEPAEIEETGEYDLEGLFIRLGYAIDSIGAKRVVLDTLETLFGGLTNQGILRAELRRLFRWLKDRGLTAVITAERGDGTLTRHGLEEYVSDCVILLDHRMIEQTATRRLRIVKYRGSAHGTNEYPFVIGAGGIEVLPITSVGLDYEVSNERVSTGVAGLDAMLGGTGYYRGSTVLVSGTAGTGKSSLAAQFVDAACRRGETCLYFAFEESKHQVARNMRSLGLDLARWMEEGLLHFHAARPTLFGLEAHLAAMYQAVRTLEPRVVVIDPITNFLSIGSAAEAKSMLTRMLDLLKGRGITALLTSLTSGGEALERTDVGISSLVDTWLLLRELESNGERNRALYLLKSRGMAHSNQVREFLLTDRGVVLEDVYVGPEGVLVGSARAQETARRRAAAEARRQEAERRRRELERKRRIVEAETERLRLELEAEQEEVARLLAEEETRDEAGGRAARPRPRPSGQRLPERPGRT
jgi:circadian clock protein KaiC